jgi:hypothetical protein
VNYYICAGSEHLFVFLLKCNKNYIILKKIPSAAQWNILHHPSTYRTNITGIKNVGHLCLYTSTSLYLIENSDELEGTQRESNLYASVCRFYLECVQKIIAKFPFKDLCLLDPHHRF